MVVLRLDPFPSDDALALLFAEAWGCAEPKSFSTILSRSLAHIGAYDGEKLVGFVNVAWDGGVHAFLLDTCVAPAMRGQGIATRMVEKATDAARARGAKWLHVDFEPHLRAFYRRCGFRPTEAGLIALT